MIPVLTAFQFLTIFPAVIRRAFTAEELGQAVGFFPLVGLAVGGILYGLEFALRLLFPMPLVAVMIVSVWLLLTRALHFDGFLDMCDGLFGGFTPERRLEIMRDSRVGAFGVAGGGLLRTFIVGKIYRHPVADEFFCASACSSLGTLGIIVGGLCLSLSTRERIRSRHERSCALFASPSCYYYLPARGMVVRQLDWGTCGRLIGTRAVVGSSFHFAAHPRTYRR